MLHNMRTVTNAIFPILSHNLLNSASYISISPYSPKSKTSWNMAAVQSFSSGPTSKETTTLDKLFSKITERNVSGTDKVTIVGAGEAGIATAFTLLTKEITKNICMIDIDDDKLRGEQMDLLHGSMFFNNAKILASKDYALSAGSRICIYTAGTDQDKEESREEFVSRNAGIIRAIVPQLMQYSPDAILLVASDPVDVLTFLAWKISGLSKNRVIGTGTNLDSARFRFLLSERFGIAPSSCYGYIIGERGENSVPVWSGVNVAGVRLSDINPRIGTEEDPENWQNIHKEVIESDQKVRQLKGYKSWAVALSIADICEAILTNANSIHPVSTYVKGEHSIRDEVFLSLPCVVGLSGVTDVIRQPLSETEATLLRKSAEIISQTQEAVKIVQ